MKMSAKSRGGETWDEGIPKRMDLIEGEQYTMTIKNVTYAEGRYGRKVLTVETDQGTIQTGAWNMINFLRDNKPVIGRKLSFQVSGSGIARRFVNLKIE